ncbi:uncharacterized protein CHSO_1430 [Chryseobacterium sp. StRB126]|nr:uncharacterized protein CHSO_1430 [Chryseobacterium sp. StRB126]
MWKHSKLRSNRFLTAKFLRKNKKLITLSQALILGSLGFFFYIKTQKAYEFPPDPYEYSFTKINENFYSIFENAFLTKHYITINHM